MTEKTDHDLLIETHAAVVAIKESLEMAGIPMRCARSEERHKSHETRLRALETRLWWAVGLVVGALILAGVNLILQHGAALAGIAP